MSSAAVPNTCDTANLTPAGDRSRCGWLYARRRKSLVSTFVLGLALFAFGAGGAAFVIDGPALRPRPARATVAQVAYGAGAWVVVGF